MQALRSSLLDPVCLQPLLKCMSVQYVLVFMHVLVQRNQFRHYLFFLLSEMSLLLALLVEEHPLQLMFTPGNSSKQGLT